MKKFCQIFQKKMSVKNVRFSQTGHTRHSSFRAWLACFSSQFSYRVFDWRASRAEWSRLAPAAIKMEMKRVGAAPDRNIPLRCESTPSLKIWRTCSLHSRFSLSRLPPASLFHTSLPPLSRARARGGAAAQVPGRSSRSRLRSPKGGARVGGGGTEARAELAPAT
jgi:hypothetical protein